MDDHRFQFRFTFWTPNLLYINSGCILQKYLFNYYNLGSPRILHRYDYFYFFPTKNNLNEMLPATRRLLVLSCRTSVIVEVTGLLQHNRERITLKCEAEFNY